MAKKYSILTSFWFLLGLSILLMNDLVFKGLYGNWLTGKLSDFAGLFVFPLFWTAFYPVHKTKIFWITGAMFVFWKSPYSQGFIDTWNSIGILAIYRTVDYSDFIALTMLPLAYTLEANMGGLQVLKCRPIYPVIVASFAFMATSYRTDVSIQKDYHFDFCKDTLINRLSNIDSLNYGHGLRFSHRNPDTVEFVLPSTFCFSNIDVKMALKEEGINTTTLSLISIEHRCPKKKNDKEELSKVFETKIIEKVRKRL